MNLIKYKSVVTIHKQNAFTLLEVIISLVIFAFVMIGLGRLMVSTVETNRDARRITAASNLAMDKIESMRGASLTSGGYLGLSTGTDGPYSEEGATTGDGLIYSRAWRVVPNTPEVGSKTIFIAVSWAAKNGGNRFVNLNTIVVEP